MNITKDQIKEYSSKALMADSNIPQADKAGYQYTGAFIYEDEGGNFQHAFPRFDNPTTGGRWMRPVCEKSGKPSLGLPEYPNGKPLFNLPKIKSVDTVYFVEGEKCASYLNLIGIIATTCGGAQSHGRADFTPLSGKTVVLWPDNEDAGRGHMEAVRAILNGLGCTTHLINIDALGLDPNDDVVDWLANNHPNVKPVGTTDEDKCKAKDAVLALACVVDAVIPLSVISNDVVVAEIGFNEAWSEPSLIPDLPAVEPFTDDLIPFELREWIADIASRMQCPKDFLGVGAIVALGSIIGRKVAIRPKMLDDGWHEFPNLWGVIIGSPSLLKTPSLSEVMKPLRMIEADEYKEWEINHGDWEANSDITDLLKKDKIKKATQAISKNKDVTAADIAVDEDDEPILKRLIVNDTTIEALGEILAANQNGVMVFRDELIALFKQLDKQGQEDARGFYLTAWNGKESHTSDRISRGSLRIEACCLSLMGGTQPSVIAEYIRDAVKNSGGDGLAARLQLMVYPDIPKAWDLVDRPINQTAKQNATDIFKRLYMLDVQTIGAEIDDDGVAYLRFNTEAFSIWSDWWRELETRLRSEEIEGAMRSHLAKYRKLVPALALIFHLVDDPQAGEVGVKSISRALAWAEYLESHAIRVYASVTTIDGSVAKNLANKIKSNQWTEFKPKDIYRNCWSGLDTPEKVKSICEVLERYDWIRKIIRPTGGRPSDVYLVNPLIGANHG